MKKVGILTFHFSNNYGAVLQCYALQKVVSSLGVECEIVDFRPKKINNKYKLIPNFLDLMKENGIKYTALKYAVSFRDFTKNYKRNKKFEEFRMTFLNMSKRVKTVDDFYAFEYVSYIVGSDQVWNPNIIKGYEDYYFLKFINDGTKRISYAPSISIELTKEDIVEYSNNIRLFDYLSLREESHCRIFNETLETEVFPCLDPTLLLEKAEYENMMNDDRIIEGDYLLVYDMHSSQVLTKLCKKISDKYNLKIVSYSSGKNLSSSAASFYSYGPSEFLNLFNFSSFVITSSFHGTAFSIIFNKPFYTINHKKKGSRMKDLLESIDLESRLVFDSFDTSQINDKIDYSKVNSKLKKNKTTSVEFLKKSLNN